MVDAHEQFNTLLNDLNNIIDQIHEEYVEDQPISMGFDEDVDYDNINPNEFLDNLAANAVILKASYDIGDQQDMANKCQKIIDNIIEIERLMCEVHM